MWILTNISQDTDGRVYAREATTFDADEKHEAIERIKEQLAEDFDITVEEVEKETQGAEDRYPYVFAMSRGGRLEAYTMSWV